MPTAPLRSTLQAAIAQVRAPGDCTDAELLATFAATRDEAAFAEIVRRHGRLVHAAARRLVNDPTAVADVSQATFLALAKQAGAVPWGRTVGPWLYQVACRLAAKVRARTRRQPVTVPILDVPAPAADPAGALAWADVRTALDDALARLPASLRDPLVLCYLEGLTRDEAAAALSCSVMAIKGRLQRGRDRLRRILERRGLGFSTALAGVLVVEPGFGAGPLAAIAPSAAVYVLNGTAPAAVRELLRSGLAPAGWKPVFCLTGLLFACALGVAGFADPEPEREPDPPPRTASRADERQAIPGPVRADLLGDPLPPGALARLGTNRLHHGSNICEIAAAADGKWLISFSSQVGYRIWDAATGKEHIPVGMPSNAYFETSFLQLHQRAQWDLVVAPAGNSVFAVVPDHDKPRTRVVAVFTGKDVAVVPVDMARRLVRPCVNRILPILSPDGKWLVWDQRSSENDDRGSRLCAADLTTSEPVPVVWLDYGDRALFQMAFSGDSKSLVLKFEDAYEVWDAGGEKRRLKVPVEANGRAGGDAILSHDGKLLALMQPAGKKIHLWDVAAGKELPLLEDQLDNLLYELSAFSPDGRYLAARGRSVTRIWNLGTRRKVRDVADRGLLGHTTFTPDGKRLALADWNDLSLVELATGKPVHDFGGHTSSVDNAAFAVGSRRLVTGSWNRVNVWEPRTGRQLGQFTGTSMAVSPDGKRIAVVGYDKTVRLVDATTLEPVWRSDTKDSVGYHLAFTPDGTELVVSGDKPGLRVYDAGRGRLVREVPTSGARYQLAFAPAGNRLLLRPISQSTIEVWKWPEGKPFRTFAGETTRVGGFDLSPDGRLLAGAAEDGFVRVLDFESGQELRAHDTNYYSDKVFPNRPNPVYTTAFSVDGRLLAAGCSDGSVRVWEVATGGQRFQFAGHRGVVWSVAFSPDGTLLVSASADRSAVTWDITGASTPPDARLVPKNMADAWARLGDSDAKVGLAAIRYLAEQPAAALALLKEKLHPVPMTDRARFEALLGRLDSPRFAEREKASQELAMLADAMESELRAAATTASSAEVRKRLVAVLAELDPLKPTGERLRAVRAVEALERIGTREARTLLEALAGGRPGARLTRDAMEALARLRPGR